MLVCGNAVVATHVRKTSKKSRKGSKVKSDSFRENEGGNHTAPMSTRLCGPKAHIRSDGQLIQAHTTQESSGARNQDTRRHRGRARNPPIPGMTFETSVYMPAVNRHLLFNCAVLTCFTLNVITLVPVICGCTDTQWLDDDIAVQTAI